MYNICDGPAVQGTLSVTAVEQEIKVGASALEDRKVVTVQPTNGRVYVSFQTGIAGFLVYKNQMASFEASDKQPIYIISVTGTVSVKIAERA